MKSWRTISRETILDTGKFLVVESHAVELPDGRVVPDWPCITPDYINALVVTEDDKFLCFHQTKYAIEGISYAPIGGYLEPGEDALVAAQRETMEETGYEASEWIKLGAYPVDGNRGVGTAHLFLALGARCVKARRADDLEEQELVLLSRADLESAMLAGEFKLLPWQTVVALGLFHLDKLKRAKEDKMPEIKHFAKRRVAFVAEVGAWPQSIQRGFERLFAWIGANNVQPLGLSLGIYYDDPAKVPADKLRSELCVPVADNVNGSGDVRVKEIGGFEAATITYQGDAEITPAYNQVYDWLHAQGYHESGAPLEVYLSQPGEEIRAEIVVPVVKFEEAPVVRKPVVVKKMVKRVAKKPVKKASAKKPARKAVKKAERK